MKKQNPRVNRMADQIQRDLMHILTYKVKDPRVEWITVNEVEITSDYSLAKVFFSLMDKNKLPGVQKALESASGFIRSELSKGLTTYTVPQLKFVFDESLERGSKILSMINQVSKEFKDDDQEA